jgi:hypothetical protein
MAFNSETAKLAGQKSKRGKAIVTKHLRTTLFNILQGNEDRVQRSLDELTPKQFLDIYIKLLPFVLAQRKSQTFQVSELSEKELIDSIIDSNET